METALGGLLPEIFVAYLGDITVTGNTFDKHLSNLKTVFSRLSAAGLKLSPKKCKFSGRRPVFSAM
ncbi:hypothetical protein JGF38_23055 [Salmonella enterica subsp. enterica serovar Hadar]|nr:hypothetical protein [Salmonella enterica subsp. enterica serovar Hadar]